MNIDLQISITDLFPDFLKISLLFSDHFSGRHEEFGKKKKSILKLGHKVNTVENGDYNFTKKIESCGDQKESMYQQKSRV